MATSPAEACDRDRWRQGRLEGPEHRLGSPETSKHCRCHQNVITSGSGATETFQEAPHSILTIVLWGRSCPGPCLTGGETLRAVYNFSESQSKAWSDCKVHVVCPGLPLSPLLSQRVTDVCEDPYRDIVPDSRQLTPGAAMASIRVHKGSWICDPPQVWGPSNPLPWSLPGMCPAMWQSWDPSPYPPCPRSCKSLQLPFTSLWGVKVSIISDFCPWSMVLNKISSQSSLQSNPSHTASLAFSSKGWTILTAFCLIFSSQFPWDPLLLSFESHQSWRALTDWRSHFSQGQKSKNILLLLGNDA